MSFARVRLQQVERPLPHELLLVIHGERDYRVPYTLGLEIYSCYQSLGLPSRLVVFPDENHWVLKARNAQRWWAEYLGWLGRFLKPVDAK